MFSNITNNFIGNNFKDIKMNCFTKRSTFSYYNNISLFDWKSWGAVNRYISMSFFISIVFRNIMKVISSNNNSSLHLSRNTNSFKNFTSDRDVTSKWTFFINISWFNCLFGCFKSKTNVFKISDSRISLLSEKFFTV